MLTYVQLNLPMVISQHSKLFDTLLYGIINFAIARLIQFNGMEHVAMPCHNNHCSF